MSLRTATGPSDVGLADTSVFIAHEQERPIHGLAPRRIAVSVITVGELRLGVLAAPDEQTRGWRLETLVRAERLDPLPIDRAVTVTWAALRLALRDLGRRMPLNDSWIAATAIAHRMPVVSQDADYDDLPGVAVIRI